ncbi:hypothetical protein SISSUDRAFT_1121507 [Sistotremastrum suecicum HHB10207 ss-3]|uniref:F-box domain-containing protein n=1 Tax=Sistotremastrum suecicum HHB10207 ss-3 TaxID=1314776 RepID=A0A166ARW6_9AGAM|nr:hypothetical protein SISSUDRAFT_1121507 [Sistotremastrum suecicum HHB10207 ss-3]
MSFYLLPEEICLQIASLVARGDSVRRRDLRSLYASSSSWRRIAMPLLWSRVTVAWHRRWKRTFKPMLDFMSTIAIFVKRLEIVTKSRAPTILDDADQMPEDIQQSLLRFLQGSENVEELVIRSEADPLAITDRFMSDLIANVLPSIVFPRLLICRLDVLRRIEMQDLSCPDLAEFIGQQTSIHTLSLSIPEGIVDALIRKGCIDVYHKAIDHLSALQELDTCLVLLLAASESLATRLEIAHIHSCHDIMSALSIHPRTFPGIRKLVLEKGNVAFSPANLLILDGMFTNVVEIHGLRLPQEFIATLIDVDQMDRQLDVLLKKLPEKIPKILSNPTVGNPCRSQDVICQLHSSHRTSLPSQFGSVHFARTMINRTRKDVVVRSSMRENLGSFSVPSVSNSRTKERGAFWDTSVSN